jgi:hypothetical protein
VTTAGALALHQVTAVYDVSYAEDTGDVTATEQLVHGLLEQDPLMATTFLLVLHWDTAGALLGLSGERVRFRLEPNRKQLARPYLAGLFASIAGLIALAYGNEPWRFQRAHRETAERHS